MLTVTRHWKETGGLVETRKYLTEGEYFTERALDKKVKTEFLFEILG